MAGKKTTPKRPLCRATRRDGTPCPTFAERDGFCAFHAENPPESAPAAPPVEPEPTPPADDEPDESAPPTESRRVQPTELRRALAEDLGDGYDLLVNTLEDAMGAAVKDAWISCRACGEKKVYAGPDHRTRLDAAAKWVELSLGRKREDAPSTIDQLIEEARLKDVFELDREEREALMLSLNLHFPNLFPLGRQLAADMRAALERGDTVIEVDVGTLLGRRLATTREEAA